MENEKDLANTLKEIQDKLKNLEDQLQNKSNETAPATTIHLHVQEVNIQNLNLDELAYHLGSIDIKELSGMLNLGNTFSPSTRPDQLKKKKGKTPATPNHHSKTGTPTEKEKNDEIQIVINGKRIIPETVGRSID